MSVVFQQLREAKRKTFLRSKPMWRPYKPVTMTELDTIAQRLQTKIPGDLSAFLLEFGFGDINDELSFRAEWLSLIDQGPLSGHIIFGQDDRGNLYTTEPGSGAIHYLDRFEPAYCRLASSFTAFLEEAGALGYEVVAWAESNTLVPHPGAA